MASKSLKHYSAAADGPTSLISMQRKHQVITFEARKQYSQKRCFNMLQNYLFSVIRSNFWPRSALAALAVHLERLHATMWPADMTFSKKELSKRLVFLRDWTACSVFANHSRLNSQHDRVEGTYSTWPLDEHENLNFDNEEMGFKTNEANRSGHYLDLLYILHELRVSCSTRSGWR